MDDDSICIPKDSVSVEMICEHAIAHTRASMEESGITNINDVVLFKRALTYVAMHFKTMLIRERGQGLETVAFPISDEMDLKFMELTQERMEEECFAKAKGSVNGTPVS